MTWAQLKQIADEEDLKLELNLTKREMQVKMIAELGLVIFWGGPEQAAAWAEYDLEMLRLVAKGKLEDEAWLIQRDKDQGPYLPLRLTRRQPV